MEPNQQNILYDKNTQNAQNAQHTQNTQNTQVIIISTTGVPSRFGRGFNEISVRHAFIRKVLLLVMTQLIVTVIVVAPCVAIPSVKEFIHARMWMYHLSYALFVILYFVLLCPCCGHVGRIWPWNLVILFFFTITFSFMVAVISSLYSLMSIVYALGATILVVFILVLFACQTKYDFTSKGSIICFFSIIFLIFGMACMIYVLVAGPSKILHMVYCAIGAFLFSLYLVYDVQLIVGGKYRAYQLSPEEYILGAVCLYLDIINIFLSLLGLMGDRE